MKWRVLAAALMLLLSLIPQIHLWFVRGSDWKGAYASIQGDESLYSAYLNARIEGRPRRNDPFSGLDSTLTSPLPESAFSIQFIPPLLLALPTRVFGANASTAFIALAGAAGLLSALSVFWLVNCIVNDHRSAFAWTLFILCFGGMAGRQGLLALFFQANLSVVGLPFERRYQPAAAFPLFFVFGALIWHAFTIRNERSAVTRAVMAGVILDALVFSYFYLWTAALAWLGCISLLWFYFRRSERRRVVTVTAIVALITLIALAPYVYLLSQRTVTLDEQHFNLTSTHQPDVSRIPEVVGVFTLAFLMVAVRRKTIRPDDNRAVYAASFALLPIVVFNQQVLTGKSMQPFHYEAFVANYAAVLGLALTVALYRPISRRVLIWIAVISVAWAALEQGVTAVWISTPSAVTYDEMIPVLLRLKELSKQDGTLSGLRQVGRSPASIFSPEVALNIFAPTWTAQGTLLDTGGLDFGTASRQTRKELLYTQLYYSNLNSDELREALNWKSSDVFLNYHVLSVIFGHDRVVPTLRSDFQPVQPAEVEQEARAYQSYVDSFSHETATRHPFTYVIARAEPEPNLSHIDLWYERISRERFGAYTLSRVRLRE